jgi:hypothetical protein
VFVVPSDDVVGATWASGLFESTPKAASPTTTAKATTSAGTSMIFMNVDTRILLDRM